MTLSQKLRAAAKSPESWDVPGLLEDAASFIDSALATLESLDKGLEKLRPLSRDEMIREVASRR